MPIRELKDQIARLPEQPGVYLYFNGQGDTIYVGKARALRDRVRNYLGAYGISPRTDALLDEVARLEVIVTDSVVEALALENNLIKQRRRSTTSCCATTRTTRTSSSRPTRPFPACWWRGGWSATAASTPVRSCRPLRAQDDVADAPAVRDAVLQRGDYRGAGAALPRIRHQALHGAVRRHALLGRRTTARAVEHTRLFLEGRNDELVETLRERMTEAARAERFEEAAQLRDAIRTIETLQTASRRWRPRNWAIAMRSA